MAILWVSGTWERAAALRARSKGSRNQCQHVVCPTLHWVKCRYALCFNKYFKVKWERYQLSNLDPCLIRLLCSTQLLSHRASLWPGEEPRCLSSCWRKLHVLVYFDYTLSVEVDNGSVKGRWRVNFFGWPRLRVGEWRAEALRFLQLHIFGQLWFLSPLFDFFEIRFSFLWLFFTQFEVELKQLLVLRCCLVHGLAYFIDVQLSILPQRRGVNLAKADQSWRNIMVKHYSIFSFPLCNLTGSIKHVLLYPAQLTPMWTVLLSQSHPQLLVLPEVLILFESELVGKILVETSY